MIENMIIKIVAAFFWVFLVFGLAIGVIAASRDPDSGIFECIVSGVGGALLGFFFWLFAIPIFCMAIFSIMALAS